MGVARVREESHMTNEQFLSPSSFCLVACLCGDGIHEEKIRNVEKGMEEEDGIATG